MNGSVLNDLDEYLRNKIIIGRDTFSLRPYQIDVLKKMVEKFKKHNKFLCEMAPGTGKTAILIIALKILLDSRLVSRALILVDMKIQQEQLITFLKKNLPQYHVAIFDSKSPDKKVDILISTVKMVSTDERYLKLYSPEDFNLTVFFDINQYISGSLASIGNYFKGFKLGILSTHQQLISANIDTFDNKKISDTYSFFNRDFGNPDFTYTLSNAVNEGYSGNPISNQSINVNNEIYLKANEQLSNLKAYIQQSGIINSKIESEIHSVQILIKTLKDKAVEDKELVDELIKSGVTKDDIKEYSYKKEQLKEFERLLIDAEYFDNLKKNKAGAERVWQDFFEKNTWIFGYGLNFIFTTAIQDKKLEQVVSGYNFNEHGKRVDALMLTNGLINSLIFAEIKPHNCELLEKIPYRSGCWRISDELSGAVSQIQKTVQNAITTIKTKTEILSKLGDPTGNNVFLYSPKSFVVIGNLKEFTTELGINEEKFSSFELFRRNITKPEIITYDELFNRAKFIIGAGKKESEK